MKKLYVEKCKSKEGKEYIALKCDFGYRVALVNMDIDICSEMIEYPIAKLYALEIGKPVPVTFDKV